MFICVGSALAQQNKLETPPKMDPPAAGQVDEDNRRAAVPPAPPHAEDAEPVVTIRQDGENRVEEYRINGRLYAVRVTPKVGKPYTMVDPDGKGNMTLTETGADDPAGKSVRPPRWVLFEF